MLGNNRGKLIKEYPSSYVVYDLETTGTSPRRNSIIEISAVKVLNHEIVDTFSTLVNPECEIPYAATAVNGITDEMVADMPCIEEVFPLFMDFVGDEILIGHNINNFDMKYLWKVAEHLYGETVTNDYVDTLPMSRQKLPELAHHRLVDLAAHYSISTEGAHRALADCIMNQKCYELMLAEVPSAEAKKCPKCGNIMKRRNGRYGEFWGCMGFPSCRYTENVDND